MRLPPRRARGGSGAPLARSLTHGLGGINVRMAVLLIAAAIPVISIAVGNAYQNYEASLDAGRGRVVAAAAVARASLGGVLLSGGTLARALVRPGVLSAGGAGCDILFDRVGTLRPAPFAGLSVSDRNGTTLCTAGRGGGPDPAAAAPSVEAAAISVGAGFEDGDGAQRRLTLLIPPDRFVEALSPWKRPGGAGAIEARPVWLIDRAGRPVPIGETNSAPPDVALLAALAATEGAVIARPSSREAMIYAAAPLGDGLGVVVGEAYGPMREAAWSILLQRLAELAAFLLVCLAAILIGADLGMVRPLRSLATRVSTWRPGTLFVPARATTEPREVADLERAFAQASAAIANREAELRAALEQRDAAMAEIHHRVKNNLQIVSSLLNLQANRIGDPAAQAEFLAARNRVRALATLHRHLYLQQSFSAVSLRPFLDELGGQQFQSHGEVPGERVALRVDAADLSLSADQAVTVALFVTEAVGNALEHAFPDGRRGAVSILVGQEGADAVVAIGDDGIGLPERPASRGAGLGLKLMDGFSRQLGGTLRRAPGPGTGWSLRFPLRERDPAPRLPSRPAEAAA